MKHNSIIRAFIFSLCLTSIQAAGLADHEALLSRLKSGDWYVRYEAAREFSVLAARADSVAGRLVIGEFVQPFLDVKLHPPAIRCEATEALSVLATRATDAVERLSIQRLLMQPLRDEDETVNQAAGRGVLVLVSKAIELAERQLVRESLTRLLEGEEGNYRLLCTIAQAFKLLAEKTIEPEELKLIESALLGFLRCDRDHRVILEASDAFKAVYERADADERLRMREAVLLSLGGKSATLQEITTYYWLDGIQ